VHLITFEDDDLEAIEAVKRFAGTPPYINNGHDYKWRVDERGKNDGTHYSVGDNASSWTGDDPTDWPVRLVCYCYFDTPGQKSPIGKWWEYHIDTKQTYSVGDNAALSAKYGLR
jgi:hypothetical protein